MSRRRENGWYHWIVLYVATLVIFFVLLTGEGCLCSQSNASTQKAQCPPDRIKSTFGGVKIREDVCQGEMGGVGVLQE